MTDPQMKDGWAVLLNDVAVHEAKAVAEALENAQVRCRLELVQEDRAFHLYAYGCFLPRLPVSGSIGILFHFSQAFL